MSQKYLSVTFSAKILANKIFLRHFSGKIIDPQYNTPSCPQRKYNTPSHSTKKVQYTEPLNKESTIRWAAQQRKYITPRRSTKKVQYAELLNKESTIHRASQQRKYNTPSCSTKKVSIKLISYLLRHPLFKIKRVSLNVYLYFRSWWWRQYWKFDWF